MLQLLTMAAICVLYFNGATESGRLLRAVGPIFIFNALGQISYKSLIMCAVISTQLGI